MSYEGLNESISAAPPDQHAKENRGKLTVFLGAAPGVGKTYTMLETAYERIQDGLNVAIGCVDTHSFPELDRLLELLRQASTGEHELNGVNFQEVDIDAIIKLKPQLVLVDDLAHSNAPGSRHVRRYQDVEELLQEGIDVYTTLNIQHVESLNDIVAKIIETRVRDTVPDHIIEQADCIQLIDVPAEELIKRFKEGKAHIDALNQEAAHKFFRIGNINALRELALRFTAGRVDKDMHEYMRAHQIEGPWPAGERVMVCVSDSPFSAQVIRAARRLSSGLQAELIAVHVETSKRRFSLGDRDQDRIFLNMRLAEELGAKTFTIVGDNLVQEVLDVARSQNVSSIVVGKPGGQRFWEVWKRSLVESLIRASGGISIYVIQGTARDEENIKTVRRIEGSSWKQYAGGLLMVAAVTALSVLLADYIELVNVALLYQLPVMMSAFWWGRWPSYFTALYAVALFDFFFIEPVFTFNVADIKDLLSFVIFLSVAFIIGGRTEYLRMQAASARQRELSTRSLYDFSREIAAVIDLDLITQRLVKQVAETVGRSILVMLPDKAGKLSVWAEHNSLGVQLSPAAAQSEAAAAAWAFEHGRAAGNSTDTSPKARYLYIPLKTNENTVGVLGIFLTEPHVSPEEKRLIEAWVGLAAIAVERIKYAEKAREAALLAESDRLRTALFNSISHELRTPLSSIVGSVSTLLEAEGVYSEKARRELLETIHEGAARMERLVSNLLDTARLESGMMQLKIDWCDIEDIIGTSLQRLEGAISRYSVEVEAGRDLPLLRADCVLLEQVMINLIDNAMKYSACGSGISIAAKADDASISVSVSDRGIGIPEKDLSKIFDKFYRVKHPNHVSGTGLGLAICKGIVEAHGGVIWAESRQGGGSIISFRVPASANREVLPGKAECNHG